MTTYNPLPKWVKTKLSLSAEFRAISDAVKESRLNTVCGSAACPNKGECWSNKHVTFLILGKNCTRSCRFCNVDKNIPSPPDPGEPERVAGFIEKFGMKYGVITSVTRDDLADKGSGHFIDTVRAVKERTPDVDLELLIPDMLGDEDLLRSIALSLADVIGHNVETAPRIYEKLRPGADYGRTIKVLGTLKKYSGNIPVKTAMMIGLGETDEEITEVFLDLKKAGVDILFIGQYLSPTKKQYPVQKYYTPEEFDNLRGEALKIGIPTVRSFPLLRSSYSDCVPQLRVTTQSDLSA
ncbi:MAG: lipoyl synthase [Candidatus Omnitrophica bacterium]|nr:lipoyl synthase [Candidatus Omnitrophota bacterium]